MSDFLLMEREDAEFTSSIYVGHFEDIQMLEEYPIWHFEERKRFEAYQFPVRRESYIMGRYAAKKAIMKAVNDSAGILDKIWISEGIFHFPVVVNPNIQNLKVSISHSGSYAAAIAFPEQHPMAIDIEMMDRFQDKEKTEAIRTQMTSLDLSWLEAYPRQTNEILGLLWTAKEALSKVLMTGLMTSFALYEINNIAYLSGYFISSFTHFPQYKVVTFFIYNSVICSIVIPSKSSLKQNLF